METPEHEALTRRIAELERELSEARIRVEILEREKARLKEFIELMPQPVFEVDCGGYILYGNSKAFELFGFSQKEGEAGINVFQMIAPETREFAKESFRKVLMGEQPGGGEYSALRKDGSEFPVIIHSVPFSSGGELRGMRGVIIDITARKQMENALRESEKRHRLIFDTAPVSIWEYDFKDLIPEFEKLRALNLADYRKYLDNHPEQMRKIISRVRLLDVNRETLRLYGASSKEEITGPYSTRHIPEAVEVFQGALVAFLEGESHFSSEAVNETPDGRRIDVLIQMTFPDDPEFTGRVLLTATDITARKQAEQALRESERRYRNIFNTVPVSIREYDYSGVMTLLENLRDMGVSDANAFFDARPEYLDDIIAAARMVDFNDETVRMYEANSREEIFQAKGEHLIPDVLRTNRAIVQAWLEGKRSLSLETVNETMSGRRIHILLQMMLPRTGEEQVLVTATDITARQQLEEERLKADKLESIGLLAGGIAHDFNNILVSILGNISIARISLSDKVLSNILSDAEAAAFRARDLTYQLLTFSKGGAPLKEAASMAEIVRESAGFSLRGSNVRCEFALPGDLWPVEVDRGQMSQVIHNLILNAMQAMPDGGTITVGGANLEVEPGGGLPLSPGRYVKITVEDQGAGISPENLSRLFDPYFTTKETGTGLGLATTWSIIRNHDGHIRADSEPGRGAVFTLYLPAAETLPEEKRTFSPKNGGVPGRILVMDDEPAVREVLSQMLHHFGHETVVCRDGREALALYREAREAGRPFDAVIMDLTIPGGMGGREAVGELLKYDPGGRVIVSSGYSSERIASDYKEHGFRANLAKPYQMEELREALDRVLREGPEAKNG